MGKVVHILVANLNSIAIEVEAEDGEDIVKKYDAGDKETVEAVRTALHKALYQSEAAGPEIEFIEEL
jgi:hypothetical protein